MATIVVDANLRSDATTILTRFETLRDEFKGKDPIEFKRDMATIAGDVEKLTQLRTRFSAACANRDLVPGVTNAELLEVHERWNNANNILSELDNSRITAESYEQLANATDAQEKAFDSVTVGQLVSTTRSMFSSSITPGIKAAYSTLNDRLVSLLQLKAPASPAVPPRPMTPDIRARTDEESHLAGLWGAWNVSNKDFAHSLDLLGHTSAYLACKSGTNQFASETARAGISDFSKKMADTVSKKIEEQKALEETAQQQCESYDFYKTNFGAVKTALFSNEPSQFKFNQLLSEAYRNLPSNLKEDLRNAVAAETRANLSDKMYLDDKQFTLVNWPGTLEQKRTVLKTFIPDTPPSPVPILSREMEVKLHVALLSRSPKLDLTPAPVVPSTTPAIAPTPAPKKEPTLSQGIDDLQHVIDLLALGKSADAQFGMTKLASCGITLNGTNMADRVNFHMYLIDRNAGKLINDPNYGANAFQGVIPAEENMDRVVLTS